MIAHPLKPQNLRRSDRSTIVRIVPETPEQRARREIDAALVEAGRVVQSRDELDLTAGRGIAVRQFAMKSGFGDYLLYIGWFPIARRCAGVTTGWQLED